MFICEQCEKERMELVRGFEHSYGACEICGKISNCLDARQYVAKRVGAEVNKKKDNKLDAKNFAWQPIESAPHDVWLLLAEPPSATLGQWNLKVGKASWGDKPGTRGRAGYATHWMPLPEAPKDE